jgi:hypothetical protein
MQAAWLNYKFAKHTTNFITFEVRNKAIKSNVGFDIMVLLVFLLGSSRILFLNQN